MKKDAHLKREINRISRNLNSGYVLDANGFTVHRKICRAFHGPFPKDWVVHHIDEDKKNNSAENLIALPRELHDKIHTLMRRDKHSMNRKDIEQALRCWRGAKAKGQIAITINVVKA